MLPPQMVIKRADGVQLSGWSFVALSVRCVSVSNCRLNESLSSLIVQID